MLNTWKGIARVAAPLLAAGMMYSAQARIARPGTINYAEGQVVLDGNTIGAKQVGSAEIVPGHVLETQNGKAEVLLTPGVFLRLDDHSAVRMISPSLTDTRVELLQGRAMVEAAQVRDENHINILDRGADARIEKHGLYEFRADQPLVAVYDGKVEVRQDDRTVEFGKGKELLIGQDKPHKFDRNSAESKDELYAWSKLRSEYEAEANAATAQTFVVGGPGWYGSGWYWNPYFSSWAFLPGDGFFASPFGWSFYSPAYYSYYAPYRVYGYRPYYGGARPIYRGTGRVPAMRAPAPAVSAPHVAPAPMGGSSIHFGGRR
jgi:hypothetical protein